MFPQVPDAAVELLFSTLIGLAASRHSRVGGVPTAPWPWPAGWAGPPRIVSDEFPRGRPVFVLYVRAGITETFPVHAKAPRQPLRQR